VTGQETALVVVSAGALLASLAPDGGRPVSDCHDSELPEIIEVALGYARNGLSVFPANAETKGPLPGYLWKERASPRTNVVVAGRGQPPGRRQVRARHGYSSALVFEVSR
jgi:hypothetical protein